MTDAERLQRDVEDILGSGINHTATFMERMKQRGWSTAVIVPAVYQLLLRGKLDPKGNPTPFRAN
jgi:hypothetical protein